MLGYGSPQTGSRSLRMRRNEGPDFGPLGSKPLGTSNDIAMPFAIMAGATMRSNAQL
jgi:hypothetical protein